MLYSVPFWCFLVAVEEIRSDTVRALIKSNLIESKSSPNPTRHEPKTSARLKKSGLECYIPAYGSFRAHIVFV